ncbi:probable cysteine--tRNA ligase, mitochondrial isoform X2 [Phymastichus coffea]|uniref:probable cysteine--tRNA ligase, mitochondrial isoform X2 n=1 Tax=Phymastichus coffea TaxID=108790 RepID=UPI00273C1B19|nr:probable cysteine--tRNA ligase, mitochondrial isoform X2 [Phymastichus coffea]
MSSRTLRHSWKRFVHTRSRLQNHVKWLEPSGSISDIVIFNPVAKAKTPLILKNNNVATWYMCGPTIYDSAHIGHASTYVKFDIIRRILSEFFDINVVLVMGMTDIDDKIIIKSKVTGKNWQDLTKHYKDEFFRDMELLHVSKPLMTCKVTDYIPEIVSFIKKIVDKGGAYVGKDGSVYFDTLKYPYYGKLAVPLPEESHVIKKSSLDFALWKSVKENEPYWESPWGKGRPGWHIECSAIASAVLGSNIDIHSGGIDLAFPHHENEEAQSCCYHDNNQWINYWLHTGLLNVQGDIKMSKSLQNTISIPTLLEKYSANEFRMLCLLSHYRSNVTFSVDLIKNAVTISKKFEFFLSDCNNYISGKLDNININESELLKCLEETRNKVKSFLANDFHTPLALQAVSNLIAVSNQMFQKKSLTITSRSPASVAAVSNYVQTFMSKLGFKKHQSSTENNDISKILDHVVDFRNEVRAKALAKNEKDIEILKSCDSFRKNLSGCGVDIRDLQEKSSWTIRSR